MSETWTQPKQVLNPTSEVPILPGGLRTLSSLKSHSPPHPKLPSTHGRPRDSTSETDSEVHSGLSSVRSEGLMNLVRACIKLLEGRNPNMNVEVLYSWARAYDLLSGVELHIHSSPTGRT